jgi:membrane associated rhomboid family serine protease
MIMPIGHEEASVRRRPWVTFGIMGLCTAVLLVGELRGGPETGAQWGLVPAQLRPESLLSFLFLHAGWWHLLGNLLILFLVGPPLEDRWGRPLFAVFAAATGLAGGGLYLLTSGDSSVPLVGMSGAVAALIGAALVHFWSTRIRFYYQLGTGPGARGTFWAPAWAVLPVWFVKELGVAAVAEPGGATAGSAGGQLAGMLLGAGLAFAVRHWGIGAPRLPAELESPLSRSRNPLIDRAMELRIAGDPQAAYQLLREAVAGHPDDADIIEASWELAGELRRSDDMAPLMLRLVKRSLAGGDAGTAARTWEALSEGGAVAGADRQLLVRLVPALLAAGNRRRAVEVLRRIADPGAGPLASPSGCSSWRRTSTRPPRCSRRGGRSRPRGCTSPSASGWKHW